MKVSIIIPVYNSSSLIERCFNSVLNQTGDFQLEIIVIDDCSTDNSVDIVKKYNNIILIQQANQGPALARNKGIERARGKYLAFLDADDFWMPRFLEKTITFLENHPEAIAVSVGQRHHLSSGKVRTSPPGLSHNHQLKIMVLDDFFSFWAANNHVCTGSVLMRTDVVKQTGGQRPDLRVTEDLEFWGYLATFGKWGFIPEVLFVSDGGEVTKSQGWWQKNIKRWKTAPSIQDWEKRILQKKPELMKDKDYQIAIGRVCKNLVYSTLLSDRLEMARNMILERGNTFPNDKLTQLLKVAVKNKILFFLTAKLLKLREKIRKV